MKKYGLFQNKEISRAWSMYGGGRSACRILVAEIGHLEDLGIDGRIILKVNFKK
jgi:hypothetical protein